ncbi:MAG: hemerythrin domain-containing protein [Desulfobacterales bacterium]|nr:hemerythrin domain-containing protein [Desulfobacterales bacterium]
MKATDELKKEHNGIELMLRVLQVVADKFKHGEHVNTEHLDGILEFLSIFVDKCHHGKEEEFLFPALEAAGVPREGGPIGVMLNEHEQGRKLAAKLKNVLTDNKPGDNANASGAQLIIKEYVALLTQHIAKENTILFPMADAKLDSKKDTELFEAFEQLERERIGVGKHEEFHVLLDQLQNKYLM